MRRKSDLAIGLSINLLIVVLEAVALVMNIREQQWGLFQYYTQDCNLFAMVACGLLSGDQLLCLRGKRDAVSRTATVLKYIAVCMLSVTFLVVLFVLAPESGGGYAYIELLTYSSMLYQHLLCPVLAIVSFLFFEKDHAILRREVLLSLIPTAIYAAVAIALNILRRMEGPYPFLEVYNQPVYMSVLWFIIILGGAYLIAWLLRRLQNGAVRHGNGTCAEE